MNCVAINKYMYIMYLKHILPRPQQSHVSPL